MSHNFIRKGIKKFETEKMKIYRRTALSKTIYHVYKILKQLNFC